MFREAWAIIKGMIPVRGGDKNGARVCPSCGGKLIPRGADILQCKDCGYNYDKGELE